MKTSPAILVLLFFLVSTAFSPAGQTETNHTTNEFDPAALGLGGPIDESTAQFLTVKAEAEKGDVEAQFDLGMCFEHGQGVTRNPTEAAKWLRKAAEHGNASAQYELAKMYSSGKGMAQDFADAAKWFTKAADQGHPSAQLCLATMYSSGQGLVRDYNEAAKWSRKAAEQGYACAQLYLGQLYADGNGVPKDFVQAHKWIELCGAQDGTYSPDPTYCKRFLTSLESMMTPAQIANAHQLALAFKPCEALGPGKLTSGSATPNLGSTGGASLAALATPPVTPRSPPESAQSSNTMPRLEPSVGSARERPYTEQEMREMLITTPFFSLPKTYQDEYIHSCREYMRKLGFEITDAEIIQEYYRRQRIALPPSNVQQHYGNQQQTPESRKRTSTSAALDSTPSASGTGFFITPDGYLITNGHVVKEAVQIRVVTSAGTMSAKVVRVDAANDLALLKAAGQFPALPVVSSRSVALGGTVATVGFPDPGLQGFSPKLAKGEIAALAGAGDDARYFQISTPLQPGNSGGAPVDEHANVVGIVSAKLDAATALASSGALPENVNYAIKSSYLLSFLESVPDVSAKLKAPITKEQKFQDVVKAAQDAAVLVLVY